jgi:hypothetical protein
MSMRGHVCQQCLLDSRAVSIYQLTARTHCIPASLCGRHKCDTWLITASCHGYMMGQLEYPVAYMGCYMYVLCPM